MKKTIFSITAALTLLTGSFSAQALCTGCTYSAPIKDFDDSYLYHWEAKVKYQYWYTNEQGQHTMRWEYLDISGTTQQYCQNQLSSLITSGATVVQFCIRTRNN